MADGLSVENHNKSGIYRFRNLIDGKFYLGSAVVFRKRRDHHKLFLNANKSHSCHLQHAWNKYGEAAFVFEILEIVEDKTKLLEREQVWLDWLKPHERNIGYNICKIADSRLGIKTSQETIAKMSLSQKGKPKSEQHRQRLRVARLGSKLTEEQKEARRNYRHTEENKLKISAAGKGRKHTLEARIKMSDALRKNQFIPLTTPMVL